MHVDYLNDIADSIKREIEQTSALDNFRSLDKRIALFQSVTHDLSVPAVTVPREDSQVLADINMPLQELLSHFSDEHDLIIWIGKSTPQHPDLKKIIPHEFRHVEQQMPGQESFIKDRALDILFHGVRKWVAPIERDASYFADKTVGLPYDASYDWKEEADNLFESQKNNIKKLYEALILGQDEIVTVSPGYAVSTQTLTEEQKSATLHFFEKVSTLFPTEV